MSAGVRCDVCGTFADHREANEWMTLTQMQKPDASYGGGIFDYGPQPKVAHICSWACLGLLAIKQDVDLELMS